MFTGITLITVSHGVDPLSAGIHAQAWLGRFFVDYRTHFLCLLQVPSLPFVCFQRKILPDHILKKSSPQMNLLPLQSRFELETYTLFEFRVNIQNRKTLVSQSSVLWLDAEVIATRPPGYSAFLKPSGIFQHSSSLSLSLLLPNISYQLTAHLSFPCSLSYCCGDEGFN